MSLGQWALFKLFLGSCLHVSSPFFFKYSYFLDSGSSDVWSQANINLSVPQFPSEMENQLYVFL